ncbi:hypothetical protein ACIG0C_28275 [Kitasatospora aureofaciens]|uniref:Uncharacterized protein n=1 Tax=Kitasatospora aureofaciens TaxID=1894 RepID=A0A1E7MYX2_KITAU|nr:hypothetical protein [Kitasatospora aureofaciens]ARF78975.1 hypothetical protein B6264_08645 [Kitasatospora aureofaciens]OEV33645.1 hypothetical protein HS99_0038580 [Kitasatospora aureofaciens]GGU83839.1 hypothetical protein GCM10010502_39960 [Kitasatospora aureofaciens]
MTDPTSSAPSAGTTPSGASPTGGGAYTLPANPKMYGPTISESQTYSSAQDLVTAFGGQNVKIEIDTLTVFANKVEALLQAMEGSAAAPYNMKEQKLQGTDLASATFTEATDLTTAYGKVHAELVRLHKDFLSQITAMKDAVAKSAGAYQTSDDNAAAAQKAVAQSAGVTTPKVAANRPASKGAEADY